MSYFGNKDYYLEIAKGNVVGHSLVGQSFINSDLDITASFKNKQSSGGGGKTIFFQLVKMSSEARSEWLCATTVTERGPAAAPFPEAAGRGRETP